MSAKLAKDIDEFVGPDLDDMKIGATTIAYGFPKITDNRKDFEISAIEIYSGY